MEKKMYSTNKAAYVALFTDAEIKKDEEGKTYYVFDCDVHKYIEEYKQNELLQRFVRKFEELKKKARELK
ncbi:hypothetical protein [Clostridium formicaceticum]|uniref:Uncharacterized protein n=1 Tax=Clostridium formicaceticum TaxID=1497 RepID=A0AAC9RKM5_9CLOT|nr:hypothetical protein [Clostridium formicaceticum]AOY76902.1 hypothetical protein BJL90_14190 [Clostridium formicaceticum]ARE87382.1 hypothetical protein CLFO_17820 [Clostridium formicaceticum]